MAAPKKSPGEESREEAPSETESVHGIPRESQAHLVRAGSEFVLAMDGIFRNAGLPEEAKKHALGMKKEALLMVKAMIDADLERCEKRQKAKPSKKVRRIKVE